MCFPELGPATAAVSCAGDVEEGIIRAAFPRRKSLATRRWSEGFGGEATDAARRSSFTAATAPVLRKNAASSLVLSPLPSFFLAATSSPWSSCHRARAIFRGKSLRKSGSQVLARDCEPVVVLGLAPAFSRGDGGRDRHPGRGPPLPTPLAAAMAISGVPR